MGYVEKESGIFDSSTASDLASAAVIKKFIAARSIRVQQVQFAVTESMVSVADPVITVKKYPTCGSAAAAVTLGAITIPAGAVAGEVYYKDISPAKIEPGDELVFEVTTVADTSGKGACGFVSHVEMEMPDNISDMVESA
jgi:hypothetical protein